MSITFNFLPAGSGDAILVSADHKNILIDGGDNRTYYRVIEDKLQKIKEKQQYLDLVVLTHVHDDHINGLLELLEDEQMRLLVKEIWFNSFNQFTVEPTESSYKTSLKQGITFNEFVDRIKRENDSLKFEKHISIEKYDSRKLFHEIEVTLLSPNEKKLQRLYKEYKKHKEKEKESQYKTSAKDSDYRYSIEELANNKFKKNTCPINGSSIAFLLTYQKHFNFLLLADAHIDIVVNSLRSIRRPQPLKLDFVKLSHHGSKHNLNQDFLDIIDTDTFIISTDGSSHNHPNKETLCKIIMNPKRDKTKKINFLFNYEEICEQFKQIFTEDERSRYNFNLDNIEEKELVFGESNGFKMR